VIEALVLLVEHLLSGSKFDCEGAHPSYDIVFASKAASSHLGCIRRKLKFTEQG
jgi:hypothetical protein